MPDEVESPEKAGQPPLLRERVTAFGTNGCRYDIATLTDDLALLHVKRLVALHNLIPHEVWTEEELLAERDRSTCREYVGKWSLSLCAFHEAEPVALLVAYIRKDNVRNHEPGLYIHRLAVAPEHQRNRLGTQMTRAAVDAYIAAVPRLKVVTVQTNDEFDNQGVVAFYRSLGFKDYSKVAYRNKQDLLLQFRQPRTLKPLRRQQHKPPPGVEACLNQSVTFADHLTELLTSPALVPPSGPPSAWRPLKLADPGDGDSKPRPPVLDPLRGVVRRMRSWWPSRSPTRQVARGNTARIVPGRPAERFGEEGVV